MGTIKRAFGYLRVSADNQVEGDGFARQKAAIESYAKSHGIRIVKYFREEGVSGTKDFANRPALQEMLIALMSNGTQTVLIERLDRLARDLMIQETIIADLRKRGFELISTSAAEADLCSDDPSRKLMRQVMGAVAEYDRAMITIKLRVARQRMKATTGSCEGQKAFGHYEGEQAVLDRLKSLRASGATYDAIAGTLNAEGVKTRSDGKWFGSTIRNILHKRSNPAPKNLAV
jgi:DNA invertase Pin-like site-specific DNA recombinase